MKVVILAGGKGSRISEYTNEIPKPMITIDNKPILIHVMHTYAKYGFKDFIIALGYKSEVIKNFFLNYYNYQNDFTINLKDNSIDIINKHTLDWNISLIDTGVNSMTGGRLKKLSKHINEPSFFVSYGDSLGNINLTQLKDFHEKHKKLVTVTAVRPQARFGELEIANDNTVNDFKEKPQVKTGWINGGYFLMKKEFLNFIDNENTILEKEPLEKAAQNGELMAFKHVGNWQCMDTLRDKENLEILLSKKNIFY